MEPMTQPDNSDKRARSIFDRLRSSTPSAPRATSDRDDLTDAATGAPPAPGDDSLLDSSAPSGSVDTPSAEETDSNHEDVSPSWVRSVEHDLSAASAPADLRDGGLREALTPDLPAFQSRSDPEVLANPDDPVVAAPPDLTLLVGSLETPPSEIRGGSEEDSRCLDDYGRPLHPSSLAHGLPRRIAIANQKGGVGKTTTTVNVGASLAELGYRVLVVDLDPQGNATTGLGVNARSLESSIYDVLLHDVRTDDVIEPTSMRNLFVVPATIDLAGAEIELVPVFSRELRLKRALDTVADDFDFVLIDCPPSLGLLTVNAMAAAGEVLVPIQCEYYALEGLGQLLRNVNLVKANLNATLDVSVIVLTMYDARTKLAEQVAAEVRDHFGSRVCRSVIPRTVRLSEAPSFGRPITTFDPSSRGAIAYRELAKEVSGGAQKRVG